MIYQYVLTGAALGICSYTDLRYRKVDVRAAAIYLVLAVLGHVFGQTASLVDLAVGVLPGAVCFVISWVSRQGLGYGDSLLITVMGVSLGVWNGIWSACTAFFWAGIWAFGIYIVRRAGRDRELPFVPFLLLGFVIQWTGGF